MLADYFISAFSSDLFQLPLVFADQKAVFLINKSLSSVMLMAYAIVVKIDTRMPTIFQATSAI